MGLRRAIRQFMSDERGQSSMEYILMLFIVVMIVMKFKTMFLGKMGSILSGLSSKLDEGMSPDGT